MQVYLKISWKQVALENYFSLIALRWYSFNFQRNVYQNDYARMIFTQYNIFLKKIFLRQKYKNHK